MVEPASEFAGEPGIGDRPSVAKAHDLEIVGQLVDKGPAHNAGAAGQQECFLVSGHLDFLYAIRRDDPVRYSISGPAILARAGGWKLRPFTAAARYPTSSEVMKFTPPSSSTARGTTAAIASCTA